MSRSALVLAAVLFLSGPTAHAAEAPPPPPGTEEGVLSFADALLARGESFRAVTEYQRLLHHFPGSASTAARALEGLGKAYAQANRWDEACSAFGRLVEVAPSAEARSLLGAAFYGGGRYAEAARVFLASNPTPEPDAVLGTLALLRSRTVGEAPTGARSALVVEYDALPRKSPVLAGGLAAALPGAGHLYAGRPRDAAASFVLNAAFLWGTWEAVRRDEWALAGILGFFEIGWYSGNVVSAVNGAHQWNRREERRFFDRHESGLLPSWSLAPLRHGAGATVAWIW
ncbi:MAG: tetratricopeptide repeat protein [Deltaproteobacteria bacterium]|nr:tetratricopeptide repeat protein [Deltaproteobacteria bacterium]